MCLVIHLYLLQPACTYSMHIFRAVTLFHGHDKHLKDNRLCGTFEAWSVSHSAALLLATYKAHFSQATHKHVKLRIIFSALQVQQTAMTFTGVQSFKGYVICTKVNFYDPRKDYWVIQNPKYLSWRSKKHAQYMKYSLFIIEYNFVCPQLGPITHMSKPVCGLVVRHKPNLILLTSLLIIDYLYKIHLYGTKPDEL